MLVLRYGEFFLPEYKGIGKKCWDYGCDVETSKLACIQGYTDPHFYAASGQLAVINNKSENYDVDRLISSFGPFNPSKSSKTFYWFWNGLKETKKSMETNYENWGYFWPDGTRTSFTNW